MAELVDAPASGAGTRKGVEVRVLFWAPFHFFSIDIADISQRFVSLLPTLLGVGQNVVLFSFRDELMYRPSS